MRLPSLALLGLVSCYEPGKNALVNLGACSLGADVDDVTHIAWDFETSAHEMIVCAHLSKLDRRPRPSAPPWSQLLRTRRPWRQR